MANINQTAEHRGHEASPLFKLPGEIRNNIYRQVFSGGEMSLIIDPPVGVTVALPLGGRRSVFDSSRSFHQFILTCFAAQEAIAIYWAETIVRNGCDGHFSRGYLINRIPAFAKAYIQHLRLVPSVINRKFRLLRGARIRCPLSFAESLHQFPKLRTCYISDSTMTDQEVGNALAQRPNVQFLVKNDYYELDAQSHVISSGFDYLRRVTFENLSNGMWHSYAYWDSSPVTTSDEELGFEPILHKAPDDANGVWQN